MLLRLGNSYSQVVSATEPEMAWLRGRVGDLLGGPGEEVPTGIVPLIVQAAASAKVKLDIEDARKRPCAPDPKADLRWLREDQRAPVLASLATSRGIIANVVGSGKSECLIAYPRLVPCHWLMLTSSAGVAAQCAKRWDMRNRQHGLDLGPAGLITDGRWQVGERLTCATFQSLLSGAKGISRRSRAALLLAEGLLIDEVHAVGARSHYQVVMAAVNAFYRYGFSFTPFDRSDGRNVEVVAAVGPVIHKRPTADFIAEGLVSSPIVEMVEYQHQLGPDDDDGYDSVVVNCVARNQALLAEVAAAEKPCLVFVRKIRHGMALRNALGLPKEAFVWSSADVDVRKAVFRLLDSGKWGVVVANVVAEQGVDVCNLRTVVVGGAGKSIIGTLQRLGRGMRVADGKTTFKVVDLVDCGVKRYERQARKREHSYAREGFSTTRRSIQTAPDQGGPLL